MAVTTNEVAELYVAYFDRAPDTDGLAYWVESGLAIEEISASFYEQEETTTNYPASMTDSVFVNTIYNNMFNHDADPDGLVYWETELANGSVTRPNMILAIANGALGTDQTILDNKTEVGLYSADKGINGVEEATDIMRDVDESDQSVTVAKSLADSYAIFNLTNKTDALVGDTGDNEFTGLISAAGATYTVGDTIDGGEGDDILKLQITGGNDAAVSLTNVETVEISGTAAIASMSAYGWNGVDTYSINDIAHTFNNIATPVANIELNKVAGKTQTLNFMNGDVVDTDNDTIDITLLQSAGVATVATQVEATAEDIYETVNVHSVGNTTSIVDGGATGTVATGLVLTNAADVTTVNIDGDSAITFVGTGMTKSTTIDASSLTDSFVYISASTVNETITGTSVTDSITAGTGGSTIVAGSGSDYIVGNGGIDNIKFDKLTDSGLTTATADKISGFTSGTDTLSFREGVAGTADNFFVHTTALTTSTIEGAVAEANKGELAGKAYVFYSDGADQYLVADTDGDGKADMAIDLASDLVATDIVAY